MKKITLMAIFALTVSAVFIGSSTAMYSSSIIEKIKPTTGDIPEGYMFGQVPDFAKTLLKNNPWNLDQAAIKKMTNRIYPGGEYTKISGLHMTIITNKKKPYGDDIVCYVFIFKDEKSAKEELAKLHEFVGYNNDRSIVLEKGNIAVYLCVDEVKNFDHIKGISETIQKRLDSL